MRFITINKLKDIFKPLMLIDLFAIVPFYLPLMGLEDAQPNVFHNILDTFWWALVTFTTVGYGDVYPITQFGKILSGIIVLIGIMLFALPTSILTAEFLNEYSQKKQY